MAQNPTVEHATSATIPGVTREPCSMGYSIGIEHVGLEQLFRRMGSLEGEMVLLRNEITGKGFPDRNQGDVPGLLSVGDVATMTGFSTHTIRDWCAEGRLPARKLRGRWRMEHDDVVCTLDKMDQKPRRRRYAEIDN